MSKTLPSVVGSSRVIHKAALRELRRVEPINVCRVNNLHGDDKDCLQFPQMLSLRGRWKDLARAEYRIFQNDGAGST